VGVVFVDPPVTRELHQYRGIGEKELLTEKLKQIENAALSE
jgi:hypothetical protein